VFGGWGVEVFVTDGGDEADDLNTVRQLQVLLGDGTGGDTAYQEISLMIARTEGVK